MIKSRYSREQSAQPRPSQGTPTSRDVGDWPWSGRRHQTELLKAQAFSQCVGPGRP